MLPSRENQVFETWNRKPGGVADPTRDERMERRVANQPLKPTQKEEGENRAASEKKRSLCDLKSQPWRQSRPKHTIAPRNEERIEA